MERMLKASWITLGTNRSVQVQVMSVMFSLSLTEILLRKKVSKRAK